MHRTIFTTPVVNTILRAGSIGFLKMTGWKVEGSLPPEAAKSVFIAAPHTSNWDLPYTLMVCFVLRANIVWMGKSSLFKWPFGALMRWLGGISVNREQSTNLVVASAQALVAADSAVQLIVPPEGTRGKTRHWKTGFYYIALQAKVPIVMAYMDYSQKKSGLGPLFYPSGDIAQDMLIIRNYYQGMQGRNPENQ